MSLLNFHLYLEMKRIKTKVLVQKYKPKLRLPKNILKVSKTATFLWFQKQKDYLKLDFR